MPKTIAYLRISSDKSDIDSQKLKILEYAWQSRLTVDEFIGFEGSTRLTMRQRRIEELLEKLASGDTLLVSELSRIGRSLGEIIEILNELTALGVNLHVIEQGMRISGPHDMATKAQVAMFGLFAELEKDLISIRTKAGMARARAEVKQIGRPKGSTGKSKLDGREDRKKFRAGHGKIIAVCNNKCGVGKTTLTVNLAHSLANRRKSVLVVDMDSQCKATSLLLPRGAPLFSLYELLQDQAKPVESMIYPTEYEKVNILPNVEETSTLEMDILGQGFNVACLILRNRLREYAIERFDYTLLDTPPNLSFFVMSALYASDFAIVPVLSGSTFSTKGLSKALVLINGIREAENTDLKFLRLLVNAVDLRTSMSRASLSMLADTYGKDKLFDSTIPTSSAFQQAEHLQKTVVRHAPNSPGAKAYRELAREVESILKPKAEKEISAKKG